MGSFLSIIFIDSETGLPEPIDDIYIEEYEPELIDFDDSNGVIRGAINDAFTYMMDYAEDRSSDAAIPFGQILYAFLTFFVGVYVLPVFKIIASTFLAVAFRGLFFLIFGQEAMSRIVGSEGYVYYAENLVKRFVGFGPFLTLFTNPVENLPKLLQFR